MIAYRKRFLARQAHIAVNYIDALFTVPIRKSVVIFKGINPLPNALFILNVTESLFIYTNFAKVVKERYDSNALFSIFKAKHSFDSWRFKIRGEAFINVD